MLYSSTHEGESPLASVKLFLLVSTTSLIRTWGTKEVFAHIYLHSESGSLVSNGTNDCAAVR